MYEIGSFNFHLLTRVNNTTANKERSFPLNWAVGLLTANVSSDAEYSTVFVINNILVISAVVPSTQELTGHVLSDPWQQMTQADVFCFYIIFLSSYNLVHNEKDTLVADYHLPRLNMRFSSYLLFSDFQEVISPRHVYTTFTCVFIFHCTILSW